MDFLFMFIMSPRSLFWLHHAVRSFVGGWLSKLRVAFPIKFSCHVAIFFSMLDILKNLFLTVSFVMRCYFT